MKTSKFEEKDKSINKSNTYPYASANEDPSENILDSRMIDERPNVNETVEKRNLINYNNAILTSKANVAKLSFPESRHDDNDNANALMDSRRSTKVAQPPFSLINKQAGLNSTIKQAGQSTADDSSGQSDNNNHHNSFQSLTQSLPRARLNKSSNNSSANSSSNNQNNLPQTNTTSFTAQS